MGCNAWNHSSNCNCGWGGEGHSGGGGWYTVHEEQSPSPKKTKPNSKPFLDRWVVNSRQPKIVYAGRSAIPTKRRMSSCPKCGQGVYFIRHNGGSVWLEPPLSPPWYKHPCFDTQDPSKRLKNKSLVSQESEISDGYSIIVTIEACEVYNNPSETHLFANIDGNKCQKIIVAGNAKNFVGELCLYNKTKQKLYALANDQLSSRTVTDFPKSKKRISDLKKDIDKTKSDLELQIAKKNKKYAHRHNEPERAKAAAIKYKPRKLQCKLCNKSLIGEIELATHLAKVHNCILTESDSSQTGMMILKDKSMRPLRAKRAKVAISSASKFLFENNIRNNKNLKPLHECSKSMLFYAEQLAQFTYNELNLHYDSWVNISDIYNHIPQLDNDGHLNIGSLKDFGTTLSRSKRFETGNFYHDLATPYMCIRRLNH